MLGPVPGPLLTPAPQESCGGAACARKDPRPCLCARLGQWPHWCLEPAALRAAGGAQVSLCVGRGPPPSKPNKSGVQGLPGLPGNGDASVTMVTQAERPRGRPGGPNGGPATHPGVQGPRPGDHTAQQTPHQRRSLTILCAHPAPTPSGIFQNSRGALHSPSLLPQTSWEPRQPGPGCGPRPGGACGGRALGSSPGGGCCLRAQPRLRGRPEGPVSGTELGREARNPAATEPASVSHSCFARSAQRGSGGRPRSAARGAAGATRALGAAPDARGGWRGRLGDRGGGRAAAGLMGLSRGRTRRPTGDASCI